MSDRPKFSFKRILVGFVLLTLFRLVAFLVSSPDAALTPTEQFFNAEVENIYRAVDRHGFYVGASATGPRSNIRSLAERSERDSSHWAFVSLRGKYPGDFDDWIYEEVSGLDHVVVLIETESASGLHYELQLETTQSNRFAQRVHQEVFVGDWENPADLFTQIYGVFVAEGGVANQRSRSVSDRALLLVAGTVAGVCLLYVLSTFFDKKEPDLEAAHWRDTILYEFAELDKGVKALQQSTEPLPNFYAKRFLQRAAATQFISDETKALFDKDMSITTGELKELAAQVQYARWCVEVVEALKSNQAVPSEPMFKPKIGALPNSVIEAVLPLASPSINMGNLDAIAKVIATPTLDNTKPEPGAQAPSTPAPSTQAPSTPAESTQVRSASVAGVPAASSPARPKPITPASTPERVAAPLGATAQVSLSQRMAQRRALPAPPELTQLQETALKSQIAMAEQGSKHFEAPDSGQYPPAEEVFSQALAKAGITAAPDSGSRFDESGSMRTAYVRDRNGLYPIDTVVLQIIRRIAKQSSSKRSGP